MAKKAFKSESKRLLDLMINSIYTNKDIFLRELISNSSDALDKLYYRSLTDKKIKVKKDKLEINLSFDKDDRTLTISDNGCGMTKEELESNLGTIAKSGSLNFKENMTKDEKIDIIGQFGVGFYSAFMVSDKITVTSKSVDDDKAYVWESEGVDGYTITELLVVFAVLGIIGTFYGDLSVLTGGIIDLPVYGSITGGLILGFLMAFGALLGDLVGSFIKRRIGLQSGEPAPIMDQLDFVVGALILSLLVVKISWEFFIIVAVLTLILHLGSNMIAYLLGIKDVWY